MRIGLQTWGSDGDIRPFCALAGGLSESGHNVTLVVTSVDDKNYTLLANSLGFKIIHTKAPPVDDTIKISRRILKTANPVKQMKLLFNGVFMPRVDEINSASKKLCEENDAVIGHHIVFPLMSAAEIFDKPYGTVTFCHGMIPTRYIAPGGFPGMGGLINSLIWKAAVLAIDFNLKKVVNALRSREGVAPLKEVAGSGWFSKQLNMIAVGKVLCRHQPDWDDRHQVCGFFNIPDKGEPWNTPDDLEKFLNAGPSPVYMTFGSMTQFAPEEQTRLMVDAANLAGVRAIIQSNWDDLNQIEVNENIYKIGKAPHSKIFPRCALVVHHGGSGTTQSSTRAGVPSVVVEHGFDQIFWGRELKRIGVAGNVLSRRRVTAKILARAIGRVYESFKLKENARAIGKAMRVENGVANAVRWIEERLL